MSESNIKKISFWKSFWLNIMIIIISILPYPLYSADLNSYEQYYNRNGFAIIHYPDELGLKLFLGMLSFLIFVGLMETKEILLQQQHKKKKFIELIISIFILMAMIIMILHIGGEIKVFSNNEITSINILGESETHSWSDIVSIEVKANKYSGRSGDKLNGTYMLYFSDGTNFNLWESDNILELYKEIKDLVGKNKIKVYRQPINPITMDFIEKHYEKDKADIIYEILGIHR